MLVCGCRRVLGAHLRIVGEQEKARQTWQIRSKNMASDALIGCSSKQFFNQPLGWVLENMFLQNVSDLRPTYEKVVPGGLVLNF